MSKVFSIIGLETNTGIQDVGLMGGIPEAEDIQKALQAALADPAPSRGMAMAEPVTPAATTKAGACRGRR